MTDNGNFREDVYQGQQSSVVKKLKDGTVVLGYTVDPKLGEGLIQAPQNYDGDAPLTDEAKAKADAIEAERQRVEDDKQEQTPAISEVAPTPATIPEDYEDVKEAEGLDTEAEASSQEEPAEEEPAEEEPAEEESEAAVAARLYKKYDKAGLVALAEDNDLDSTGTARVISERLAAAGVKA